MTESTPELLEETARRIAKACGGCTCGSHLRAAVRMLEDLDDRTMDLLRRRTEALNRVVKEKDELREALIRVLGAAQVAPGATVDPTAIHDAIGGELISALYFPDFRIRFTVGSYAGPDTPRPAGQEFVIIEPTKVYAVGLNGFGPLPDKVIVDGVEQTFPFHLEPGKHWIAAPSGRQLPQGVSPISSIHSTPGLPVSSFVVNPERHDG